jgi:hypothetical protein
VSSKTPPPFLFRQRTSSSNPESVLPCAVTHEPRAIVTAKWAEIGKSAETLEEVVEFYEKRFNIGLTAGEKTDLVAFLRPR